MSTTNSAHCICEHKEAGCCTHDVLLIVDLRIRVRQLQDREQGQQPHAAGLPTR